MKLIVNLALLAGAVAAAPFSLAQQSQPAPEPMSQSSAAADPAGAQSAGQSDAGTRLAAIVPPGMTPETACSGLKSLVECSAALHASQNLNIPFADVKDKLAGGQTLEATIHALKPGADARKEVQRAQEQATADLHPAG